MRFLLRDSGETRTPTSSAGINGRRREIEPRPGHGPAAWTLACALTLALALTLPPFAAQEPHRLTSAFTPQGSCAGDDPVRWLSLAPAGDRDMLDRWCDSVGPPVVTAGGAPPEALATVVVATWNVHAGNGDVESFLASLAQLPDVHAPYGVVLLLQEAARVGAEVPARYPARMRPPRGITPQVGRDVGALVHRRALHAVYVPSMRNGRLFPSDAREDRGNAILSTLPLDDLRAIELPFGRQRHVAVAARVRVAGLPPLRVMAVHLDPSGHREEEATALAALLSRWTGDEALVVGGDLNTWFGRREGAFKALAAALPEEDCGRVKTNSWPWRLQWPLGWWRGRLDYLFSSLPPDLVRSCQTVPRQYGSDHRPVVLTIAVAQP
jgi:endonuclease/exonuclease/phosphatase family metal-dependent hydrolase